MQLCTYCYKGIALLAIIFDKPLQTPFERAGASYEVTEWESIRIPGTSGRAAAGGVPAAVYIRAGTLVTRPVTPVNTAVIAPFNLGTV